MVQIVGRTNKPMDVSDEGHTYSNSYMKPYIAHESEKHFGAFSFISSWTTDGANQEVFYLENEESNVYLHIHRIAVGLAAADQWTLFRKTSGTPAGTDITPVNLNFGQGRTYSYTCKGNAEVTGSVSGQGIVSPYQPANTTIILPIEGIIIMGKDEGLGISIASSGTAHSITVVAYWDDH